MSESDRDPAATAAPEELRLHRGAPEGREQAQFRSKSFWLEGGDYQPGLGGSRRADVAIIGAGFTGLSAAYFLKQADPSLDIVVLEQEVVGFGASGRNGGFVMPLLGWNIPDVYKRIGYRRALQLQDWWQGRAAPETATPASQPS
jgi:hypothetical protein